MKPIALILAPLVAGLGLLFTRKSHAAAPDSPEVEAADQEAEQAEVEAKAAEQKAKLAKAAAKRDPKRAGDAIQAAHEAKLAKENATAAKKRAAQVTKEAKERAADPNDDRLRQQIGDALASGDPRRMTELAAELDRLGWDDAADFLRHEAEKSGELPAPKPAPKPAPGKPAPKPAPGAPKPAPAKYVDAKPILGSLSQAYFTDTDPKILDSKAEQADQQAGSGHYSPEDSTRIHDAAELLRQRAAKLRGAPPPKPTPKPVPPREPAPLPAPSHDEEPPHGLPPIPEPEPMPGPAAGPPAGLSRIPAGSRTLKQTTPVMSGSDVWEAQTRLNAAGAALVTDGKYGPKSVAAAKIYQRQKGLVIDGKIGPKTWGVLLGNAAPEPAAAPKASPAPSGGGVPEDPVREAAIELTNYLHSIGGLAGRRKEDPERVKAYQRAEGASIDGKYGSGDATRILNHGIVPVVPFYWSSNAASAAKQKQIFLGQVEKYRQLNPALSAEYDALKADTNRS